MKGISFCDLMNNLDVLLDTISHLDENNLDILLDIVNNPKKYLIDFDNYNKNELDNFDELYKERIAEKNRVSRRRKINI